MSLYDKDYAKDNSSKPQEQMQIAQNYGNFASFSEDKIAFVKQTYKMFALSLFAGAVGSYCGVLAAPVIMGTLTGWSGVFIMLAAIFGLSMLLQKFKTVPMLFIFAFTFGLLTSPIVTVALNMQNGGVMIGNAFVGTALIVAAVSLFAIRTQKDLTGYGKQFMIAILIIIGVSLLNVFIFKMPALMVLINAAAILIFAGLTAYDTQMILKGHYAHPIDGAIQLYLDFLNIFINLLQLFMAFAGKGEE